MVKPQNQLNLAVQKLYQQRITLAKHGQQAFQKEDFKNAIKYYNQYLKLLSDINEVDITELNPKFFDKATQTSEMFLISQVYWDLAKIYDLSSQLRREFLFSLNQFLLFTVNHSYQVVNSEILRKFIRKGRSKNIEDYKDAYKKIAVTSKKCFIATYAFGDSHHVTNNLRLFKKSLVQFPGGVAFVRNYYRFSPHLVQYCQDNPFFGRYLNNLLLRPALSLFSKMFLRLIIK